MVRCHAPVLLSLVFALASAPRAAGDAWAEIVRTALGQLQSNPAGAWACTVESTRNATRFVERGEGGSPGKTRWTLAEVEGRAPTPGEIRDHEAYRATQASPLGVNFRAADLDLASVTLVHRGEACVTVSCGFSENAIRTDRLLGHLDLTVLVDLRTGRVARYTLTLRRACSPVLGVRLQDLEVRMDFDHHGAPLRSLARSRGSVFFRSYSEEIVVRFSSSTSTVPAAPDGADHDRRTPQGT